MKTKLVLKLLGIDINDNNPQQRRQKLVTSVNGSFKSASVHCRKQVI